MSSLLECAVCRSPGKLCSRCRVDAYCGPEHQKQDWPRHKAGCGAFKVEDGRLRAVKDIKKGTVIIKEAPVVVAPLPALGPVKQVMCVGCCYEITGGLAKALQCGVCGLPVCCKQCAKDPAHQDECGVLRDAGYKAKRGSHAQLPLAVAILRVALAARREPRLRSLPTDFTEGRVELKPLPLTRTAVWPQGMVYPILDDDSHPFHVDRVEGERVVRLLRETIGVTKLSEQELLHAATLLARYKIASKNAHPEAPRQFNRATIFLGYSQLEHSCVPNMVFLPWKGEKNPYQEHVVVAGRDIRKNECLSRDFSVGQGWTMSTMDRQTSLICKFGFVCRCIRCEDPTELGQYVGSLRCRACAAKGESRLLMVSKDALSWSCKGCLEAVETGEYLMRTQDTAREQFALADEGADPRKLLAFLERIQRPGSPLHSMHQAVLTSKFSLCTNMVRMDSKQTFDRELDAWERVFRDVLEAMDKLWPGMSEPRRQVLMGLGALLSNKLARAIYRQRHCVVSPVSVDGEPLDATVEAAAKDFLNRHVADAEKAVAEVSALLKAYMYGPIVSQ